MFLLDSCACPSLAAHLLRTIRPVLGTEATTHRPAFTKPRRSASLEMFYGRSHNNIPGNGRLYLNFLHSLFAVQVPLERLSQIVRSLQYPPTLVALYEKKNWRILIKPPHSFGILDLRVSENEILGYHITPHPAGRWPFSGQQLSHGGTSGQVDGIEHCGPEAMPVCRSPGPGQREAR